MIGAHYRVGTVTVTYGSTTVTGALTAWIDEAREGDTFVGPDGRKYEIAETPAVNTTLTLRTPYRGPTASNVPYAIWRYSRHWSTVATLAAKIRDFLQSVVVIVSGVGPPSNTQPGGDGTIYVNLDQNDPRIHRKTAGAFDAGIPLRGPPGPAGPGISTTSSTTRTIGTGSQTFIVPADGTAYQGARLQIAMRTAPQNYMNGIVVSSTSTSVTVNVLNIGGSGTSSDWVLVASGDPGPQGMPGSPSTGASASTVAIGVGNLTFAVPAGLDLVVGQRVRFAATAAPTTQWVEGIITAYAGGSMTINVANDGASTSGSGTVTAWNFGLIGSRGVQGAAGAASSVPGPVGPSYNATSSSSVAIGTGNRTFAIGANTAYAPGSRVRVASTATPSTHWMEGECVTYSGGNITIAVDLVGTGTGTLTSWSFSLAGEPGIAGANGTSLLPQGNYNALTTYSAGRIVRSGGASWVYINAAAGAGNAPPTLPVESNTHWQILAQDGSDGIGLVDSVNGVPPVTGDVNLPAGAIPVEATAANITPLSADVEAWLLALDAANKPPTTVIFTASGTWTKPIGCVSVSVTVVGGGGGGGTPTAVASSVGLGASGGGGGTAHKAIDVRLITSEAVTVGGGGAGGGSAGSIGTAGGTSSFGTHCSATGGGGGSTLAAGTTVGRVLGGNGGSGVGGDINIVGGSADPSVRIDGSAGGGWSPSGGSSSLGAGARGASSSDGTTATGIGGGGSGAISNSATVRFGGAGAGGIVIVTEYYS